MGAITAKFDLSRFQRLVYKLQNLADAPIDKATAEKVGEAVLAEVKSTIAGGTSPIAGKGDFPAYKHPERYPGKQKPHTPVNLYLSGKFQKSMKFGTYRCKSGYGTKITYPASQAKKEQGHRDGANGQPKRPTLPTEPGEEFSSKIVKIYFDLYETRIRYLLKL